MSQTMTRERSWSVITTFSLGVDEVPSTTKESVVTPTLLVKRKDQPLDHGKTLYDLPSSLKKHCIDISLFTNYILY